MERRCYNYIKIELTLFERFAAFLGYIPNIYEEDSFTIKDKPFNTNHTNHTNPTNYTTNNPKYKQQRKQKPFTDTGDVCDAPPYFSDNDDTQLNL